MTETKKEKIFSWQHYSLIFFGLIIFVLLFFATKTSLNNPPEAGRTAEAVVPASKLNPAKVLEKLPAIQDEGLKVILDSLDKGSDSNIEDLRTITETLRDAGLYGHAAVYAIRISSRESNGRNLLVAGALSRNSLRLPTVSKDTALFSFFVMKAISSLEKAQEMEPTNEKVMNELALAYLDSQQQQNSMKGIMLFKSVLELNPNNEEAAFHLARSARQVKRYPRAEELFRKVLEINPGNVEAKWDLATLLVDMEKVDEAGELLIELKNQEGDQMLASAAADLLEKIKK